MLTIASLLTIFLFVVHLADDIAHGFEGGDLNDLIGGTAITTVWLYGTLVLRERLAGRIITFVGGIFSVLVPYVHMRGAGMGEVAKAGGGFWFALTLLLMALAGVFTAILSVHIFWNQRKAKISSE
jgi:hypothetical protein